MARRLEAAIQLLSRALEPVGTVRAATEIGRGAAPVARVEVELPQGVATLALRELSDPLEAELGPGDVLVLERVPLDTVRALRAADRQFIDLQRGAVRLHLPWMILDRTDIGRAIRTHPTSRRAYLDPFGDRASLVTRLLVEQPARAWGAREIASEAGVSPMTASHVLRQLREIGAIDVSRRGRAIEARLRDVRILVEHWTRAYDWRRSQSLAVQAPIGSPERFFPRLVEALRDRQWALTMHAGASFVARHAVWDTVHVYVASALHEVASTEGWTPGSGKLVLMRPYYGDSLWKGVRTREPQSGVRVVSDLQLILDLWHYPVRGREQAEVMLGTLEERVRLEQRSR